MSREYKLTRQQQKIQDWQQRSRQKAFEKKIKPSRKVPKSIKQVSVRRLEELREYGDERPKFLEEHPICPVTGEKTTQVHHSAHREGAWLNLKYFWIATSARGHRIIEDNKVWARSRNLLVSVNMMYDSAVSHLVEIGEDIDKPIFYTFWKPEFGLLNDYPR